MWQWERKVTYASPFPFCQAGSRHPPDRISRNSSVYWNLCSAPLANNPIWGRMTWASLPCTGMSMWPLQYTTIGRVRGCDHLQHRRANNFVQETKACLLPEVPPRENWLIRATTCPLEFGWRISWKGITEFDFNHDNEATMSIEANGRALASTRLRRYVDISYFFIKDKIEFNGIMLRYNTAMMLADFLTKPPQGRLFHTFRTVLLGQRHLSCL